MNSDREEELQIELNMLAGERNYNLFQLKIAWHEISRLKLRLERQQRVARNTQTCLLWIIAALLLIETLR